MVPRFATLGRIPKGVWVLGGVSLLMDVSSEMIHSLLPLFMATTLGASVIIIGLIEGLAEATALILKVFSGVISDYVGKRKGLALLGYGLGALSKPLFAIAPTAGVVFSARMIDRVGKGIRGAPRDALVADVTPPEIRGAAYGLRQALDTVGAFLGPLLAVGLAITGALAVMCMAKVYGVTFLGAPRTREAENACCAPVLMTTSVVALALCCIAGGVAAPWLLPLLGHAIPLPLETAHTVVSQPMIALLLIAAPLLPFVLMLFFRRGRLASRSRGAAWACGYEHEQSMVITAHGFAMPVKENFAAVLKLRHWLNPVGWVPGWQNAAAPALFRRLALIELAVLVVIVISRGA